MIYRVRTNAHITIFESDIISVSANSPEEAKELADEAFRETMNEKYGWVDIDETFCEECVECQQIIIRL